MIQGICVMLGRDMLIGRNTMTSRKREPNGCNKYLYNILNTFGRSNKGSFYNTTLINKRINCIT